MNAHHEKVKTTIEALSSKCRAALLIRDVVQKALQSDFVLFIYGKQ